MIDFIQAIQRVLGVTNRELGERLGFSTGYLSRLYKKKIALRLDHVLAIVAALGFRWEEFFRAAYPPSGEEPSAAAKQMQAVFDLQEGRQRADRARSQP